MNSEALWAQGAQQFQQIFGDSWAKALQSFQNLDLGGPPGKVPAVQLSPAKLQALQEQYLKEAQALWSQSLQGTPEVKDRRFSGDGWASNPVAAFSAAAYLLNARTLMGLADAVEGDEKTRARIRFGVEQWMAAMAPSNFLAFNAEAQKKAIETKGESIVKGMQNLLHDTRQGHVSMTDESLFEVGRNVATTEGAVVYENELFQLLEYKPLTTKVYERPFLLVPPCINKFYILDLQPDNSFIRYAVEQGHRTFVVSWRNPHEDLAHKTWDDYVEDGAMAAIDVVQSITGADQINALGFCVGGTILSNALAVMAARGQEPVASATFLTTLIDFADTGILDVFIDEAFVQFRELQMGKGGLMKGQDLASTFSFLRPNDLVWNYVVATTSRAKHRPRSTCCTGTATAPICPAPSTPGICATSILKTTWCSRASSPSVARSWTWGSSPCPCTSTARAKTTSCPSTPRTRPPRCCLEKSGLSWGPRATSPVSSTPPPRTNVATGFASTASCPPPWSNGLKGPQNMRAAGGPTGPTG